MEYTKDTKITETDRKWMRDYFARLEIEEIRNNAQKQKLNLRLVSRKRVK